MMTSHKPSRRAAILLMLAGAAILSLSGMDRPLCGPQELSRADDLYRQGRFDEAARLYAQIAAQDPASYGAALGMGRIQLLRNSLSEAETWLKKARELNPQEREPQALLGEVLYRRGDYAAAAPFFESLGQKAKAEKLKAFQDRTPFLIESGPDVSALPFVVTDPLPQIKVTINGQEGTFLIDTGAWELHVMPAFAEKSGLKPLATTDKGIYAGGRTASNAHSLADSVRLGDFALRNVPVVLPQSPGGPFQVDGIVGTVVLYQFLFTLDYPKGRLILRRNTPEMSKSVRAESEAAGAAVIPFWLAGDHFVYAWGTANGAGPYLFFVDTGLAGGGFICTERVLKEAKIELPKEGIQGMGGGGAVTSYPFTVDLTLGKVRRDKVRGMYGAIPPGFDERQGFRSGGIISHGFFRAFAVTFDFQAMALYLK